MHQIYVHTVHMPTYRRQGYHTPLTAPIASVRGRIEITVRVCDADQEAVPIVGSPYIDGNEVCRQRSGGST